MRIYVWDDWAHDWTSGLAVAIAESEEEAKAMIIGKIGYDPSYWGEVQVFTLEKNAFCVAGGA